MTLAGRSFCCFLFFFGYGRLPADQLLAAAASSLWTSSSLVSFQCPSKAASDRARDHAPLTGRGHKACFVK